MADSGERIPVWPPTGEFDPSRVNQILAAIERRLDSLAQGVEDSGGATGSFAALEHTHTEADITDLGPYLGTDAELNALADVDTGENSSVEAGELTVLALFGSEWQTATFEVGAGGSGEFVETGGDTMSGDLLLQDDVNLYVGDDNDGRFLYSAGDDTVYLVSTRNLYVGGVGNVDLESTSADLRLSHAASFELEVYEGSTKYLSVFQDTDAYVRSDVDGTNLVFSGMDSGSTEQTLATFDPDGGVALFFDGSEVFTTTATGGTFDSATGDTIVTLESTGSDSSLLKLLDNGGGIALAADGGYQIVQTSAGGTVQDTWIDFDRNGAVTLYTDNTATARTGTNTFEVWDGSAWQDVVLDTRQIIAGDALTGTGDLSGDVTLNVDLLGIEDLTDPGADRVAFWDDSAGVVTWLTMGTGLTITGTTLDAAGDLDSLTDVTITGVADDEVLVYDSGGAVFQNEALLGIPALTDPGADRIMFWDDSAGVMTWLTVGSNLSISGTTLDATTGGGSTTLSGLDDVTLTSPAEGHMLYYDNASSDWVNTSTIARQANGIDVESASDTPSVRLRGTSTQFVSIFRAVGDALYVDQQVDSEQIKLRGRDSLSNATTLATFSPDGSVDLYHDGSPALATDDTGINVQSATSTTVASTTFLGSDDAQLGVIFTGAGDGITVRSNSHGAQVTLDGEDNAGTVQTILIGDPDGNLNLFFNGNEVAETRDGGFTIIGDATDTVLDFYDNASNQSAFFQLLHGSSGTWVMRNLIDGANLSFQATNAASSVTTPVVADPDDSVTFSFDGTAAAFTTGRGLTIKDAGLGDTRLNLANSSNSLEGLLWASGSALNLYSYLHGGPIQLLGEDAGGSSQTMVYADPDAEVRLYYDGTQEFRTADSNATDFISGAEVKDYGGTWRQVGFLDSEPLEANSNRTIGRDDWGKTIVAGSGTPTYTFNSESNVPNGMMINIYVRDSSGSTTLAQGSGVTLRWFAGAGGIPATGNRTLASGAVASVWKFTDSEYWVTGVGIS